MHGFLYGFHSYDFTIIAASACVSLRVTQTAGVEYAPMVCVRGSAACERPASAPGLMALIWSSPTSSSCRGLTACRHGTLRQSCRRCIHASGEGRVLPAMHVQRISIWEPDITCTRSVNSFADDGD